MKKILILITALILNFTANAQCPDFTNITASNVKAFTGTTSNPFAAQGVVNGRHTVITTQGTDPNTGGALQLLPPGETSVVRLGNEQVGAEAEALSYSFTVDANNPVLLVKFAVVMQDPGHPSIAQPRFVIRITDPNGDLIEPCAEYDVSAREDIPGFQSYQENIWEPVRWRDWTNVGLDMTRFAGQTVQVQFITYDCDYSGHFGYAYFTASCMSNQLQLDGCTGSQFTLEAPDNFENYHWSNGSTSRTTTYTTADVNNSQISCIITSATGCQFPLYAYVTTNPASVTPGNFTDIICEGETYTKHNFNLPAQQAGKHFYQNVIVNPSGSCSANQKINLTLTVVQRYTHFKAAICHGQSYSANGFNIKEPAVGVRRDTIKIGTINGCDTYNVLELTVNPNLNMPNVIQGNSTPCTDEFFTYTFAGAENLTRYEWILPSNAKLYKSSRFAQTIQVYFTDDTPGIIQLSGQNGCGTGTATLNITPKKSHNIQKNEKICQGENFNLYDFNLGVQDSVGYFVYSKHLTSSFGCDSIVTLALSVLPKPEVRIEPAKVVLCNAGEEITLWALTGDMKYPGNKDDKKICGDAVDYDLWYNTLTPTDESKFAMTIGVGHFINGGSSLFGEVIFPKTVASIDVGGINTKAFDGNTTITEIILPLSATTFTLNPRAFGNMPDLTYVTIPENVKFYDNTVFQNSPNVIIRCYENSTAHKYATNNGINFELIENCENVDGLADNESIINIYDCNLSYLWNTSSTEGAITVSPTQTTEYSVIITTQSGCSAEAKQTVVVNTNAPQTINVTICEGETYTEYGLNAKTSGIYPVSLPSGDCSITLNVDLNVMSPVVTKITDEVCAGTLYKDHGLDLILIEPGIFKDTIRYRNVAGCISITALEINVLPDQHTLLQDTICQNDIYSKNGFNLGQQKIPGKFTHTRKTTTGQGCQHTITLQLLVNAVYTNIISDEVDKNEAYSKYGFDFATVTADITDTLNLQSIAGCDSTVVLNLKVIDTENVELKNDTVHANCNVLNFNISLLDKAVYTCSSPVVTLLTPPTLTGNTATIVNDVLSILVADDFGTITRDSVQYEMDCSGTKDTAWVQIYINQKTNTTSFTKTIYEGNEYDFNGQILTEADIYTQVLPSVINGCDSTLVLNLKVIDPSIIENVELKNDTVRANCNVLNFNISLLDKAVYTCSSPVVTLLTPPTLTGNTATIVNDVLSILVADDFGTITRDSVQYEMDCSGTKDTAWVQIYINQKTNTTSFVKTMCEDDEYNFKGQIITKTDIYTQTLPSIINGCDSILILDMTVFKHTFGVPEYVKMKEGETYTFHGSNYATAGVYYAATTNAEGCNHIETLYLEIINADSCPEIEISIFFTPNNNSINDKWLIENIECQSHHVEIYDRFGKLLRRWENNFDGWDGLYQNIPVPTDDYWYIINLNNLEKKYVGHFTLIRP